MQTVILVGSVDTVGVTPGEFQLWMDPNKQHPTDAHCFRVLIGGLSPTVTRMLRRHALVTVTGCIVHEAHEELGGRKRDAVDHAGFSPIPTIRCSYVRVIR